MNREISKTEKILFDKVSELLILAKNRTLIAINTTMVMTYFQIGKIIIDYEQSGTDRAAYNTKVIQRLSNKLTEKFGKGYKERNLRLMRQFYQQYRIRQSVIAKSNTFQLSWTHYIFLIRMDDSQRSFYEIEAIENNWSVRELERQFDSGLYERLLLNKDKGGIKRLKKGQNLTKPSDAIKDPYILEFLGLEEHAKYSETDLESRIISNLEAFMLELGKGFAFVARQKRITLEEDHFFIDLVFYNHILKSFVIIDLKIGKLKHQDLGQLQMYVNYYDRFVRDSSDNKTIGIILASDKNDRVVKITLPEGNEQIFASKYKMYLPTKKELSDKLNAFINN